MAANKTHGDKKKCGDFGGVSRNNNVGCPCRQPAGFGTSHPGTGKCKYHGGASTGRPPKTGKYAGLPPVLNDEYLKRLLDPSLKSLDDETALTEVLIAEACKQLGDGGLPDWSVMSAAFSKLEDATVGMDKDGFVAAMTALKQAIEQGRRFSTTQQTLLSLIGAKAALVEKSTKIEERARLVVSMRDWIATVAWVGHFVQSIAERFNEPGILREFEAELVRKGAYAAPRDGFEGAGASGGVN